MQYFLCKDDDGDTLLCNRETGPCKASVLKMHKHVDMCPGCPDLEYKLVNKGWATPGGERCETIVA